MSRRQLTNNRPFFHYYTFNFNSSLCNLLARSCKLFTPGERFTQFAQAKNRFQVLASKKAKTAGQDFKAIRSAAGPNKVRPSNGNAPNGKKIFRNSDRSFAFNYSKFSQQTPLHFSMAIYLLLFFFFRQ
jgi:hypothetical protein